MKDQIRIILNDFFSLLFPIVCLGCEGELLSGENILCTKCRIDIPRTNNYLEPDNNLKMKFEGRLKLTSTLSYLKYTKSGKVKKIIQELKYKGNKEVGVLLGNLYAGELKDKGYSDKFDVIIPVPLHKNKERKRGYNQSTVFASGLSEVLNVAVENEAVVKFRATKSQTSFSRLNRFKNVENVFMVQQPEKITGKNVVIVDDIVTTGATIEMLALEILKYHPNSISVLALAEAID